MVETYILTLAISKLTDRYYVLTDPSGIVIQGLIIRYAMGPAYQLSFLLLLR